MKKKIIIRNVEVNMQVSILYDWYEMTFLLIYHSPEPYIFIHQILFLSFVFRFIEKKVPNECGWILNFERTRSFCLPMVSCQMDLIAYGCFENENKNEKKKWKCFLNGNRMKIYIQQCLNEDWTLCRSFTAQRKKKKRKKYVRSERWH